FQTLSLKLIVNYSTRLKLVKIDVEVLLRHRTLSLHSSRPGAIRRPKLVTIALFKDWKDRLHARGGRERPLYKTDDVVTLIHLSHPHTTTSALSPAKEAVRDATTHRIQLSVV
ncbi:MAG: hypothetical protein AAFP28_03680, partial [Pseudomonadota bacterium]